MAAVQRTAVDAERQRQRARQWAAERESFLAEQRPRPKL